MVLDSWYLCPIGECVKAFNTCTKGSCLASVANQLDSTNSAEIIGNKANSDRPGFKDIQDILGQIDLVFTVGC